MTTTIKRSPALRFAVIGVVSTAFAWIQGCGGIVATNSPDAPEDSGMRDTVFPVDAPFDVFAGDVQDTSLTDIGRDDEPVPPKSPWSNDAQANVCMQFGKGWKSAQCQTCLEQGPPTFSQFEGKMSVLQDLECEASIGCVMKHCLKCQQTSCESDTCKCIELCMPRGNERCINAWQSHMTATLQTCSNVCE